MNFFLTWLQFFVGLPLALAAIGAAIYGIFTAGRFLLGDYAAPVLIFVGLWVPLSLGMTASYLDDSDGGW